MARWGPSHAYPAQLAAFVLSRIDELGIKRPALIEPRGVLASFLSVAFQASLLRDEDRALTFRLILASPDTFPSSAGPPSGMHRLLLDPARPFEVHEIRKLAPAVKFQRSLVGVDFDKTMRIWGIIHSGPRWLHFAQGGRGLAAPLPDELVVHVNGPGDLVVSLGARTLARLFQGELTTPVVDIFDGGWLSVMFAGVRREVLELHEQAQRESGEVWRPLDETIVRRVGQNMIRRIIATIRASRHGGSVLILPSDELDEVRGLVDIKYVFEDAEPRRRFRTLLLAIMREVARLGSPAEIVDSTIYDSTDAAVISALDEAVLEVAHLIAALADVDGMVVMTQRYEIIGFGGVVSGRLDDVPSVAQALDVVGNARLEEATDRVGTRHRAAYRICAALHDALVLVVSQDGSVRFVRWHEGAVTYWDQVAASAFGG